MRTISPIISLILLLFVLNAHTQVSHPDNKKATKEYEVAVYYFPNFHLDKRNENYHGKGWSEWELVKEARPRFEGHRQPKVPLWGYTDEADPDQMAEKIQAASSNGIYAFIFDWYYYNDGLFLERALEEGFMKSKNNNLMKFSIMWANHDWVDCFPCTAGTTPKLLYPGKISIQTWDKMTDYIIANYFRHPSYWLIDGAPYFSIYHLNMLIDIFGTVEETAKGLENFRIKTKAAGFSDLNLNAVINRHTKQEIKDPATLKKLGFNSFTTYTWFHHVKMEEFPTTQYDYVREEYFDYIEKTFLNYDIPYYPNVTMGWDASPRTNQNFKYEKSDYPFTSIIVGNTPDAFTLALKQSKSFLDKHSKGNKILTINAWNEWTEGSYLEPDIVYKMGYLEAIKEVFTSTRR